MQGKRPFTRHGISGRSKSSGFALTQTYPYRERYQFSAPTTMKFCANRHPLHSLRYPLTAKTQDSFAPNCWMRICKSGKSNRWSISHFRGSLPGNGSCSSPPALRTGQFLVSGFGFLVSVHCLQPTTTTTTYNYTCKLPSTQFSKINLQPSGISIPPGPLRFHSGSCRPQNSSQ